MNDAAVATFGGLVDGEEVKRAVNRTDRVSSSVQFLQLPGLASQRRALDRTARQALPRLADFCLIHVATAKTLRCIAEAHRARHLAGDMQTLVSAHRIRRDDLASTVAAVARSRKPALRTTIYDDDDRPSRGVRAQARRRLAPTSALVVPVVHHGEVLGTLSLCYSHSGRSHGPHQVPLAERLATRIAEALTAAFDAASRLRTAARHARQRTARRRRVAARD
jgi:GAF domain-containing protein